MIFSALNLHFRTPTTHIMPEWVKWLFLKFLPKVLFMRRPLTNCDEPFQKSQSKGRNFDFLIKN